MKLKYITRESKKKRGNGWIYFIERSKPDEGIKRVRPYPWVHCLDDYMWDKKNKRWITSNEARQAEYDGLFLWNGIFCNWNYKKFRRMLKKWSKYIPEGVEFVISGRFEPAIHGWTTKGKR